MDRPRLLPAGVVILLAATGLSPLTAQDRCEVRRELDGAVDATPLTGILVAAAAGALEVVGSDQDGVRVRAVVCASSDDLAADARLVVEPRRGAAWIEADLPEPRGWGDRYVRMDLVVEMPRTLAADIRDSSGEIQVRGIAAVRIDDGSGSITVEEVAEAVEVTDRSGDITVRRVGSVQVEDGSGDIEIEVVNGGVVVLEDGSGGITVRDVTGDVRIDEDGSGGITVERVGGDFVVERDGSGSVRHVDVRGAVRVPPDA